MLIKIRNLTKSYKMGSQAIHALAGVDLDMERNEYTAIMGPSGSGKTTFMNIIGCLDTSTSGTYELNGHDVTSLSDDTLAFIRNREIGFVFQTFNLLPRATAYKNIELPLIYAGIDRATRKERVWEALGAVGLKDRAQHRPSELSGGQRQKVAIGRALANRPSIILADEPTGNLDSKTGEDIMNVFEKLRDNGNTIIIVTHEEYIARFTKRMVKIRDGRIESDSQL